MKAPLTTAARYLPKDPATLTIKILRARAKKCRACPLYKLGTQTVFGEGPSKVRIVFVGEQPGNQEDLAGRPFVGPAGRLLDQALVAAKIDRSEVYVTNAVKHFKWTPVGKRRLHQKPNSREIAACRPWLDAELAVLRPAIVVALGATAAQALMGPKFRVTHERGKRFSPSWAKAFFATVHPSSILRGPPEDREAGLEQFIADLKQVAKHLSPGSMQKG
jgi:uracil-DNA glycosylase